MDERKTKRLRESPVLINDKNDKCIKSRSDDEYKRKRERSESRHKEDHRKRIHETRIADDSSSRKRSQSPSGTLYSFLDLSASLLVQCLMSIF